GEIIQLNSTSAAINQERDLSLSTLENAETEYLAEIDGTGGSMRYGIAGVAAEKENALNRSKQVYNENLAGWSIRLDSLNNRISTINKDINKQTSDFRETGLNSGFLIRVEALMSLFEKDGTGALKKRYYLILVILVIFELIPIISKLFLQTGSYDDRIKIRDEMETEIAYSNRDHEQDLKQKYNKLARDADMALLEKVFENITNTRLEKINGNVSKWENDHIATFDELWDKIKTDILTRQES
ncbi:MAG: DUF4407 domain-containing protein, partial [Bacteroidales bacterium]|nr:DUF4407 domain-containing protein [Bacteroidales bacterium]